jgi:hypothetical protein
MTTESADTAARSAGVHRQAGAPAAVRLTLLLLPLLAAASLAGLLWPGLYREPAAIVPAMRGQDFITLLCVPALLAALLSHRRQSPRGTLAWIGLLGYVLYTYVGSALAYYVNQVTLLYIALLSMSGAALVCAIAGVDPLALQRAFGPAAPRRAVAAFLVLIALMLVAIELPQLVGYLVTAELPDAVKLAGGGHYYVYGLDLGVVVPLCLLAAVWLWQRRPWAEVLAGYLLIKSTTMGLALLAMNLLAARSGTPVDAAGLLAFYSVLAAGGASMTLWFFAHCRVVPASST